MSENECKHVQTALTQTKYERFRQLASEQDLSLKEAGRKALISWIERQQRVDPNDPAFTVFEELKEISLSGAVETDACDEDDPATEWHGNSVEFRLAKNPKDSQ